MKKILLMWFLVEMSLALSSFGTSFKDLFYRQLMEVGWKKTLTELDRYTADEQRYVIERALLSFGSDHVPRAPERQECFENAQKTMLALPGHATYYQDRLKKLRAEFLVNAARPIEEIERMRSYGEVVEYGEYNDFRKEVFPILSQLPSSETVSVLGHFLNDPESRDGRYPTGQKIPHSDAAPFPPNCAAAWIAIVNLGIENPPGSMKPDIDSYSYDLAEVDAWKNWWNEIKDGKRTYRFIGSPIEYGADGPASKEVITRATMNRKRDEDRLTGKRTANLNNGPDAQATKSSKPSSIAGILAACALVAASTWYYLSVRQKA